MTQAVGTVAGLADWRDYLALLKPRVMSLVVFTGLVGLMAAPGALHPVLAFTAILCIAVGAGAAGAFNQWHEIDLDARMARTANRPLPAGRVEPAEALAFAVTLGTASVLLMGLALNWLAAGLLVVSILYYTVIYTIWLKPRTPQNIVIGGAAGAFPPLIGWVAATGQVSLLPLLLFLIIFLWTPPHFWALALFVRSDYARAGIPMLPVTHGDAVTRAHIWWYTLALVASTLAPWIMGLLGATYGLGALVLGGLFIAGSWSVWQGGSPDQARRLFGYSILYLFFLFALVVADRVVAGQG